MLQAIKKKVILDPDGKKNETESGIYTGVYSPDGALRYGTVVSVGDMCDELKAGDRVCWLVQDENGVTFEDKRYVTMYETQIIGKIDQ